MVDPQAILHLLKRLAETVAWCKMRGSAHDPVNSLRTTELRPANLSAVKNQWGNYDYNWGTPKENQGVVETLAATRAAPLREMSLAELPRPNREAGRLLVAMPEESDWCGLSEPESRGFVDGLDVPAWDTWVTYIHEPTIPDASRVRQRQDRYRKQNQRRSWLSEGQSNPVPDWQPPTHMSYLLCWIPTDFEGLVQAGIEVNPVQCFRWAAEFRAEAFSTATLMWIDEVGLAW